MHTIFICKLKMKQICNLAGRFFLLLFLYSTCRQYLLDIPRHFQGRIAPKITPEISRSRPSYENIINPASICGINSPIVCNLLVRRCQERFGRVTNSLHKREIRLQQASKVSSVVCLRCGSVIGRVYQKHSCAHAQKCREPTISPKWMVEKSGDYCSWLKYTHFRSHDPNNVQPRAIFALF